MGKLTMALTHSNWTGEAIHSLELTSQDQHYYPHLSQLTPTSRPECVLVESLQHLSDQTAAGLHCAGVALSKQFKRRKGARYRVIKTVYSSSQTSERPPLLVSRQSAIEALRITSISKGTNPFIPRF